jgi:hypothetical protein
LRAGAAGALGRLVLPPTRTLALVEYLEPQVELLPASLSAVPACQSLPANPDSRICLVAPGPGSSLCVSQPVLF